MGEIEAEGQLPLELLLPARRLGYDLAEAPSPVPLAPDMCLCSLSPLPAQSNEQTYYTLHRSILNHELVPLEP